MMSCIDIGVQDGSYVNFSGQYESCINLRGQHRGKGR